MLVYHARFLANSSETAAKRLISQFETQSKSLRKQPERFPWLSQPTLPEHKYRKFLFEKREIPYRRTLFYLSVYYFFI
jgi:plasmid stabilization system protein ParE